MVKPSTKIFYKMFVFIKRHRPFGSAYSMKLLGLLWKNWIGLHRGYPQERKAISMVTPFLVLIQLLSEEESELFSMNQLLLI